MFARAIERESKKALEQGRKEGMVQGMQKASLHWIQQLTKLGVSQAIIAKAQKNK